MGQVINGKYRVLSVLGEGGFGIVYKVELLLFDTGNIFALKLLHPALSQDKSFRRRFLREAGLAMALIHENTIQIREFGQTDDGHLFFTMDYCEGEPLRTVMGRERFLTVNRAILIVRQILSVIRLAHARGIIHRDIKPENIFLEKDQRGLDFVKVGDFGLAKSFLAPEDPAQARLAGWGAGPQGEDITRGGIVGTPRYMSPEQALGREDVDDRSDVYSIGVVFYEMLYGSVPPERGGAEALGSPLKTPACPQGHPMPRAVWEVVRKALEIERDDRYQSAEEFLSAIDALPQYTPTYIEPALAKPDVVPSWVWWTGSAVTVAVLGSLLALGWKDLTNWPEAEGPSIRVLSPSNTNSSTELASGAQAGSPSRGTVDPPASARSVRTSAFSPLPADGIRAYAGFRPGDVLRYQTYREGPVLDRELSYEITGEPEEGVFTVRTRPGDRSFRWIVDSRENALYQEFVLPNSDTGELTETVRRMMLKLPRTNELVDGDYHFEGLKMHGRLVSLKVPRQSNFDVFTDCLCVESRAQGRTHCLYFQEGRGLVAVLVFEPRARKSDGSSKFSDEKSGGVDPSKLFLPPVPPGADAGSSTDASNIDYVMVYARYLVEHRSAPAR